MKQKFIVEIAITVPYSDVPPSKATVAAFVEETLRNEAHAGEEIKIRKVDFD